MKAFIRYANARYGSEEREEVYRILTSRYLRLITGAESDYYTMFYETGTEDFDPEQVVDSVIAKVVGE